MKPMMSIQKKIAKLKSQDDGVAAIEFGLFTPVLFFSLLATIDVGMAVNERMLVDQALRAGAEQAMYDPGSSTVQSVVEDAGRLAFNVNGSGGSLGTMTVTVTEYCACPSASTVQVSCSTTCTTSAGGAEAPYKYYTVAGQKTYDSIVIPAMTFNSTMTVQVR